MTRRAISYLRFSSAAQRHGDSERRQEAAFKAYVSKHNLTIDERHTYKDFALSGYSGDNLNNGALGVFLEAIKRHVFEPGSVLLIESIDRLSRAKMANALKIVTDIIHEGIEIVTLDDGTIYSVETLNENDGLINQLIGEIRRARRESERKSKLVREAYEARRDNGRRIKSCPGWLILNPDGVTYTEIPEKVAVVRRIFELADAGVGQFTIARTLNAENAPTLTDRATGWHTGPINALLQNPAVIGHFQHSERDSVTGERKKIGSVIEGYYPAIIDPALFKRVSDAKLVRKGMGGRRGDLTNFLAGILECAECGKGVAYFNNGNKQGRHWGYLRCDAAFRRTTHPETGERICFNVSAIAHSPTQRAVLDILEEFGQLPTRLANEDATRRVNDLSRRITVLEAQFKSEQDRLMGLARSVDLDNVAMMDVVRRLGVENNKRMAEIAALEKDLVDARASTTAEASIAAIKALRVVAEGEPGDDRKLARSKIIQALREVVDFGICYPDKSVCIVAGGGHLSFFVESGKPSLVVLHRADGRAMLIENGKAMEVADDPGYVSMQAALLDRRRFRGAAREFFSRGTPELRKRVLN